MKKYLAIILWVAAAAMFIAEPLNPGSGWVVGGIGFTAVGCIVAGYSKYRTGKWFTNESGGH
ncbi:hypothetical protein FNT36_03300 [Hymenobacter setariae]|uniref:Uncharacterized protein n=1 Tax=Hymenobacter setariae TaxID=2594794 RepID=A0A558C2W2_9BACT|nr:hypothetical protein [Hymenobacter setariae]TVT43133.1 hypothetical protein FNT36_03300 [Hymenobacter setariae]